MNEMSLEEQIQCMRKMHSELEDFCNRIRHDMDEFQDDILYLKGVGFSVEKADHYYSAYYVPANDDVEQVIKDIQIQHFDYIERVIERLERILREQ